jgi:peptidyl-prolyl cis-trans isomerase SurA
VIKFKKLIFSFTILLFFTQNCYGDIKDSLYATVGNKAITYSDIINEVKVILITNNQIFSEERRKELEATAIKATIQRNIKKIEIEKFPNLSFSNADVKRELETIAKQINMSLDIFVKIFDENKIDINILKDRIETELLWNSLIFKIYKNNLKIDENEINEQITLYKNKPNTSEFLLSEIIFDLDNRENFKSEYEKIKKKIKSEGFEKVAMTSSITETAKKGGNLGWISENSMADKFKKVIFDAPVGGITEPILLPNGVLIFKVNDKRSKKVEINLEKVKNQLVNNEKKKLLKMYSLSHYDRLRRSVSIDYYKIQ